MKRALAFLCGVCLAAAQAWAEPAVDVVRTIVIPVSNLDRSLAFYTGALSFEPTDPAEMPGIALQLGQQRVELVRPAVYVECGGLRVVTEAYRAVLVAGAGDRQAFSKIGVLWQ